LNRIERYRGLSPRLDQAIDFLAAADLAALETGRHVIDGDRIYATASGYQTRPLAEGISSEAHRRYIDIQVIVGRAGADRLCRHRRSRGFAALQRRTGCPFPGRGQGDELLLSAGDFAVFWPEDAHRPCMAVGQPEPVRKVVVKVLL
jgi:YhcH/YjgK/YiaL family protein